VFSQVYSYPSADSAVDTDNPDMYPIEFLHSLTPSDLPPHKLDLKVGVPVTLLRNIDPGDGLASGTRDSS
jgi:ATP-dependent DNA helicase PIF1